ncbi:MAG: efflux RND transporter periplasmic adaptor subunit [Woeseia sp.]
MNRNRTLKLAAMIALAAVAGCRGEAATESMPPPPEVSVATVLVKEVRPWDEFTGHIEAVETVELRPRVSGYIERVNYEEGGEVAKGDVLFVIDQRTYRAELARAEAELARATTQAELARSEVVRAKKLADARAISTEELDQRNSALAQSEANIRAAQAAVDVARLDLEFTEVRAPISGRAGRALVTPGNLVSTQPNATILTTIVSLDPVYVYFEGDERSYLRYNAMSRNGERQSSRDARNPVRVGLAGDAGYPYEGEMDFMDNQVNSDTGTIRARAVLPNPDRVFTPGLFARVQLAGSDTFRATLIDDKAVLTDQDRKYVYVVGEDASAQRRDVQLGRMIDGLRVVEAGLEPGDQVIVHGVQKIFMPGMPVNPQVIAMGDPPPGMQTTTASAL